MANENARATQQAIAQSDEITAKAQRSAAEAQLYQGQTGKLDLSTVLALDSWQKSAIAAGREYPSAKYQPDADPNRPRFTKR